MREINADASSWGDVLIGGGFTLSGVIHTVRGALFVVLGVWCAARCARCLVCGVWCVDEIGSGYTVVTQ